MTFILVVLPREEPDRGVRPCLACSKQWPPERCRAIGDQNLRFVRRIYGLALAEIVDLIAGRDMSSPDEVGCVLKVLLLTLNTGSAALLIAHGYENYSYMALGKSIALAHNFGRLSTSITLISVSHFRHRPNAFT